MKLKPRGVENLRRYTIGFLIGAIYVLLLTQAPQTLSAAMLPDGAVRPDTLVSFTQDFREDADTYWSRDREYAACVDMKVEFLPEEDEAQIQLVFGGFRNVIIGSEDRAMIPSCRERAVIHSHPTAQCRNRLWTGDIPAAEDWYRRGGVAFLIQCAPDKFEVYTRDTGLNGVIIQV